MSQVIDIILLVICIFFSIRAYMKGFLNEFFSLLAFVGGVYLAYKFSPVLLDWLQGDSSFPTYVIAIIYGGVFIVTYIIIKVLEMQFNRFINIILLTGLNKLLGLLFGLIEAIVVISILTYIIRNQNIIDVDLSVYLQDSKILEYIDTIIEVSKESLGLNNV